MDQKRKILMILALVGLAVGAFGVVEALLHGTNATGLTSYVPWGLGVVVYLYFLGLSAGAFLVSILVYVFGLKKYEPLGKIAAWAVVVTEVCAGGAIALDLGRWGRMYRFMLSPSLDSPMLWMFVFFTLLLVIYLLKIRAITQGCTDCVHKLSIAALPVGLLFYGTNGYFFSILASRPVWNNPLVPFQFVLAALLTGGALLAVLALAFPPEGEDNEGIMRGLGRSILFLLVLFLLVEAVTITSGLKSGKADVVAAINAVLCGPRWWSFWIIHLVLGGLLPFLLLIKTGSGPRDICQAGLLILATFPFARYDFVIPAQGVPMLPGLDTAFIHPRLSLSYSPDMGEWLVTLFFLALALFGFLIGPKVLPALFTRQEGDAHA